MFLPTRCVAAAVLLARAVGAATASHEVVTFDYSWRFHLHSQPPGPPPPPTPPPSACSADKLQKMFPVDNSRQRKGLGNLGKAETALECASKCCQAAEACFSWQFSNRTKDGGCWGGWGELFPAGSERNWSGGTRAGKPPPTSPPSPPGPKPGPSDGPDILPATSPAAAPGFDDSDWQLVQLPHDYVVEGAYSASVPGDQGPGSRGGGAGQSYLPRHLGFYRKKFTLPASWKGNVVWIYFEGVFRASKFWLNGQAVREHAGFPGDAHGEGGGVGMGGGYTSFSVRLDNATTVHMDGKTDNVLAVYVDPRMGSGWFCECHVSPPHIIPCAISFVPCDAVYICDASSETLAHMNATDEGGGIYRKTYLHSAPPVHLQTDGVFARTHGELDGRTARQLRQILRPTNNNAPLRPFGQSPRARSFRATAQL
jgi:hypothetical protein